MCRGLCESAAGGAVTAASTEVSVGGAQTAAFYSVEWSWEEDIHHLFLIKYKKPRSGNNLLHIFPPLTMVIVNIC